jgi:hypothetical protein
MLYNMLNFLLPGYTPEPAYGGWYPTQQTTPAQRQLLLMNSLPRGYYYLSDDEWKHIQRIRKLKQLKEDKEIEKMMAQ